MSSKLPSQGTLGIEHLYSIMIEEKSFMLKTESIEAEIIQSLRLTGWKSSMSYRGRMQGSMS